MSWFNKVKNWLGLDDAVESKAVSVDEKKPTFEFITKCRIGFFYQNEKNVEIATQKIINSSYKIDSSAFKKIKISANAEVLDMKLRNKHLSIFNGIDKSTIGEHELYVIAKYIAAGNNVRDLNLYNNVFDTEAGNTFAIAYVLFNIEVLKELLNNMYRFNSGNYSNNTIANEVVAYYKNSIELLYLLEVFYPAFANDLIQLSVVEKFLMKQNKVLSSALDLISNETRYQLLELRDVAESMFNNFLSTTLNISNNVVFTPKSNDWRDDLFLLPFLENKIEYPSTVFGEDVNRYLELVRLNLSYVKDDYIENDLSGEIPKMFSDILSGVVKNFLAMPAVFRNTMKNDEGKTVEMMLLDVLEKMNNRLLQIAQVSHEDNLREVSVLNEFSEQRWKE